MVLFAEVAFIFPLQDFCPDRLEVLWSILELKGL